MKTLAFNETVSIESDDVNAKEDIAKYLLGVFSNYTLLDLKPGNSIKCNLGDVDYYCYQKTIN